MVLFREKSCGGTLTIHPLQIMGKYCRPGSTAFDMLVEHGKAVAKKALHTALRVRHLGPDETFIGEAALLHDIGIVMTNEPRIGCYGTHEYICHGYLGRELLEREGLMRHALVCERHVGVGLSIADIDLHRLGIPRRDMLPRSLEEEIICYADKFFSKRAGTLSVEKSLDEVRASIARYGRDKLAAFDKMHARFSR
jgi:uncharacterized protein